MNGGLHKQIDVDAICLDPDVFQVRRSGYAEAIASAIAANGWDEDIAGDLHVWEDEFLGRFVVLDGHSRMEGINRLREDKRPKTVRCIVYKCSLDDARAYANSLNANRRELTPTELAGAWRTAIQIDEELYDEGAGVAVRRILPQFAGSTLTEIERNLPLAWLGKFAAGLVDDDFMPVSAGRSLGRFLRRTGMTSQQGDEIASAYIASDLTAHQFGGYLQECEGDIVEHRQEDMFGEYVGRSLAKAQVLIAEIKDAVEQLARTRARRDTLLELEGTIFAPTEAQRRLIGIDQEKIGTLERFIASKSKRLQLSKMMGDK